MRFPPRARTGRLWVTRCHGRTDAASRGETVPKRRNCTASPDRSFQVHRSQPGGAAEALDPGGGCRALVAGANTHSPRTGTSPRVTEGLFCTSLLFPPAAYVLACMTTSGFHPGMSPGTDSKSPGAQMRILSWFPLPRPHCCNAKTSPDVHRVSCASYSGLVPAGLCSAVGEHVSPSHHP